MTKAVSRVGDQGNAEDGGTPPTSAADDERGHRQAELDQREEYVAAAARELMNPIAAIAYAARALQAESTTLDVASVARGIAAEAAAASELIRALLDAARADAGRLHLALAAIDLLEVARATLQKFRVDPEHRIVLVTQRQELPVRGDPGALANLLRHLLGNAVAYGRAGPVRLEIDVSADGRVAIVAVRDSGPGIPEPERPLLFRKFARLSTASGTSGAGLGLYLSRAILEEHGGVLSADWPSDGGSRFWFTLPTRESSPGRRE